MLLPDAPRAGQAALHVAKVRGRSTVVRSWARSPLRLLTPRTGAGSVWAYTSNFGGGIVAGDRTSLELRIENGAACFLSTQASTKVYRNPARLPCSHELRACLGQDSLLILAPDPIQCFAHARYEQRQHFELTASSNLIVVDWISGGRTARGERWMFDRYFSRIQIERGGSVLADALLLENDAASSECAGEIDGSSTPQPPNKPAEPNLRLSPPALAGRFRLSRFNCLATVVLLGPALVAQAQAWMAWVSQEEIRSKAGLVVAISPLREGALMRVAGTSVEEVARLIARQLSFVRQWLQDDPWSRKW